MGIFDIFGGRTAEEEEALRREAAATFDNVLWTQYGGIDTMYEPDGTRRDFHAMPKDRYTADMIQAAVDANASRSTIREGIFDKVLGKTGDLRSAVLATQAADFTPALGTAIGLEEADYARQEIMPYLKEGDYKSAAIEGLNTALGFGDAALTALPIAGGAWKTARRFAPNTTSDAVGLGRSLLTGDLQGIQDTFTRSRPPKSLSAASEEDFPLDANLLRERVQMYSPSTRAAENLKQEKGTYEQLRKMMLNSGAKADELSWSGADAHFQGKKVTKQEIVDYLRDNTDMIEENRFQASGKLGENSSLDPDQLAQQYVDLALDGEMDHYYNDYLPEMVDELDTYIRVSDAPQDILEETASRKGITVDRLLSLHDDEYIDLENSLRLKRLDEVIDANFNVEDMARESLYDNAYYEASRDPETFMQDYLGMDPDEIGNVGDTQYSKYFTGGAKDYTEKVYSYDDPTKKIDTGLLPNAGHFNDDFESIVGHSRTGNFPLTGGQGDAMLIGELQSDVGQDIRKYNLLPQTYEELVARSDYNKNVDPYRKNKNQTLFDAQDFLGNEDYRFEINQMFSKADLNAFNKYAKTDFNDYKDMSEKQYDRFSVWAADNRMDKSRSRYDVRIMDELASDLMSGNIKMSDVPIAMRKPMQDFIDARIDLQNAEMENAALLNKANRIDPETGARTEAGRISTSLPYVDNTSKWVDMMLRRNIYDAIKEGENVVVTPNSTMVRDMTYGTPEGQGAFYEGIVPKRLQNVAQRIDPSAKLEPMQIHTDKGIEDVFGLRLNDEFLRNAAKKGIPTWMIPAGVGLGGLMDYLKEKREQPKFGPRRSLLEM